MNREPAAAARIIQDFANELTRAPLYECGHADAWQHVQRAHTIEDLLVALGYCEGYADCARLACPWDSPAWRIADTLATAARTLATSYAPQSPPTWMAPSPRTAPSSSSCSLANGIRAVRRDDAQTRSPLRASLGGAAKLDSISAPPIEVEIEETAESPEAPATNSVPASEVKRLVRRTKA